jgi:hypothetical protein
MRRYWDGLGFLVAALLILSGCATEDHLKPPKPQECFNLPPDEKRYQEPTEYPKKYLMEDMPQKTDLDAKNKSGLGNGMGGQGGMGNQRSY